MLTLEEVICHLSFAICHLLVDDMCLNDLK